MSQPPAIPDLCHKSIASTPSLTWSQGSALPTHIWSSYSIIDFLRRVIAYFGYKPKILQTDNGTEFTHTRKTDRIHPLDAMYDKLGITHKRIRPRTP